LTEELVSRGHDVTLYASGDSVTRAHLVDATPQALRLDTSCRDALAIHHLMFERILRDRNRYDLIHFHTDYLHFSLARHLDLTHITTLHGRLDLPELVDLYREFGEMPVISISNAQRSPLPQAHWVGTVLHGLPPQAFQASESPGEYLAFLGRVSPEKGLEQAIEVANRLGIVLRVAAKVDRADRDYYIHTVAPLLHSPYVEFIGEISEREKSEFLGGAQALLFPIDWPEPFGLVLIEAMACGTPVVAYRRGSVPEIITEGETGYLVDNVDQAVSAVKRLPELSRRRCREIFDERFTVSRMADDYLRIYAGVASQDAGPVGRARGGRTAWNTSSPHKTSSPSSPHKRGLTNEPVY
jgi:glycosyltransferase involved in cell wall biosynthesis